MRDIQRALEFHSSGNLIELEANLKRELEVILSQEEIFWYQKSRHDWIAWGDRNTSYFHRQTIQRRRTNRIDILKDDNGNWISDAEQIKSYAVGFFTRLYTKETDCHHNYSCKGDFPIVEDSQMEKLNQVLSDDEIRQAIFSIQPFKVHGIDGLHVVFYQSQWDVVRDSVCTLVKRGFTGSSLHKEINKTLIVLIPKTDNPSSLKMYRN